MPKADIISSGRFYFKIIELKPVLIDNFHSFAIYAEQNGISPDMPYFFPDLVDIYEWSVYDTELKAMRYFKSIKIVNLNKNSTKGNKILIYAYEFNKTNFKEKPKIREKEYDIFSEL